MEQKNLPLNWSFRHKESLVAEVFEVHLSTLFYFLPGRPHHGPRRTPDRLLGRQALRRSGARVLRQPWSGEDRLDLTAS